MNIKDLPSELKRHVIADKLAGITYDILEISDGYQRSNVRYQISNFSCPDNLTSYTVPDFFSIIGDDTFMYCRNIRKIEMRSIEEIGYCAFLCCSSLEEINFVNELSCVRSGAFTDCVSLKMLKFPKTLKIIYNESFDGCSSLKRVFVDEDSIFYKNLAAKYAGKVPDIRKITISEGSILKIEFNAYSDKEGSN